ncbi:mfs transporter [Ophiostoma piceae UAMH 11346]|uniref:Mfs transporter n=1 Tax=Ophiostoma piceae (strain UAMH 11346) TaxID=1262450 RepID=S3CA90_OPHP1|nr:mfs transporter [Ophiostoma piceae UAMH 11346]
MGSAVQKCRDPDAFPAFQLFFLAIVRLAEPIALTSIFPYAWALVKHFQFGQESDASFYAGILISAFSLAEAVMGMYWGGLSDRIGRKPVLLVGCIGTMLSMLVVGLAPNIYVALAGRVCGGLLNGNIGVIQTMVGELVKNPDHEPRAYAIMPFVWSIGTIIGPAIGGTFADPRSSFPDIFPAGGLFDRYPYLLPNMLCALLLLVSIVLGYFLLDETHPDLQPPTACSVSEGSPYVSDETPLLETSDALKRPAVDLRAETYGTFGRARSGTLTSVVDHTEASDAALAASLAFAQPEKPKQKSYAASASSASEVNIFAPRILSVVLALAIFSYHSMVYDSTLPIFFEDDRVVPYPDSLLGSSYNPFYSPGGLGLSLRAVGIIMAINGAIALFVQAVIFPIAASCIGVYRLFLVVTLLHPLAYVVLPVLLYVPAGMLHPAIYACLSLRNLFAILVYPLLLILIKEATPSPSVLGKVNGMAASAGAACRMVAPPIAGYLYTLGSRIDCTALAWYGGAFVALIGAVQCFSVERPKVSAEEDTV